MPISHQLRTLFIHIPKTGGSSIERALGMTPEANYHEPNAELLFGPIESGHLQHTPLNELLSGGYIDRSHLDYFKFAFVRNPWDRVVSEYFYRQSLKRWTEVDFAAFVRNVVPVQAKVAQHFYPQSRFTEGLDFVGRFENLQRDFDHVCECMGIAPARLPHIRKREHLFYPDYYDAETRAIVADVYREDIERFGYAFESSRWGRRITARLSVGAKKLVRRFMPGGRAV